MKFFSKLLYLLGCGRVAPHGQRGAAGATEPKVRRNGPPARMPTRAPRNRPRPGPPSRSPRHAAPAPRPRGRKDGQ